MSQLNKLRYKNSTDWFSDQLVEKENFCRDIHYSWSGSSASMNKTETVPVQFPHLHTKNTTTIQITQS